MSELKAYGIRGIDGLVVESESGQLYLKSEADKVIAELKAQKVQAEDDCAYWKMNERNAANAMHQTEEYAMQLYKEANHYKYKRCLAMAKWCEFRSKYYDLLIKVEASYLLSNPHNVHKYERKAFLSKSWRIKWLELAEKFKEGK